MPVDQASLRERRRREGEAVGGVKIGVAFFGWLTAVGMAVLLTALIGAVGAGLSFVADVTSVAAIAFGAVKWWEASRVVFSRL